jgi:aspartate aminotransferase
MKLSKLAEGIRTSEIIQLAAEINERIHKGEQFYNLTIGDFSPGIFAIPAEYRDEIIAAYKAGHTNYPGAVGVTILREAIARFLQNRAELQYSPKEILISSGARPLIYASYRTVVDRGDRVIFPTPSWNNDHYCKLLDADALVLETLPENNFMPAASELEPHVKKASLIALCSPLNPTGTAFSKSGLEEICDLVLQENRSRGAHEKPLYIIYDQIYWLLTFGETRHYNPVTLRPELRPYTIFVDGMSKAFAATGVRVGWAFAPQEILGKMKSILAHMGAWAPKSEQVATGNYLRQDAELDEYLSNFRKAIQLRLQGFYKGFISLREKGFNVNAIEPQAAIYLTAQLDLRGKSTPAGKLLSTNLDVHRYILEEARIGLVPFSFFGASEESSWYRLSVGTCCLEEVEKIMSNLEQALGKLS